MKTIEDILTGYEVLTLPGEASAAEAARKMHGSEVGAVMVRASDGALGIFTERDLMKRVVVPGLDPNEARIESLMTRDVFSAAPHERVNDVAQKMQERHIRHLPVVRDGQVICLLSFRDLLRELLTIVRGEVDALTSYIQGAEDQTGA